MGNFGTIEWRSKMSPASLAHSFLLHCLAGRPSLFFCVAVAACVGLSAISQTPQNHEQSLTILVPGMNDEASKQWLRAGAALSAAKTRYAIEINGEKESVDLGKEVHVIRINVKDAKSVTDAISRKDVQDAINVIAAQKNATVIVDMKIGVEFRPERLATTPFHDTWARETSFAGTLAAKLTEAHQQKHPNSYNILFGHSAGTEVVRFAHSLEGPQAARLFNLSIAASPRHKDGFALGTVMAVADGDFYYSPYGIVPTGTLNRTMNEADAIELASKGYVVMRTPSPPSSFGGIIAHTVVNAAFPLPGPIDVQRLSNELTAHGNLHEMASPLANVVLYSGHNSDHVEIQTSSMGSLLSQITHHPALVTGTPDQRFAEAKKLRDERAWIEPTEGLGGISFNAIASAPFDPAEIDGAAFDPGWNQIVLSLRDGHRAVIALPHLSIDALRAVYQAAYVEDAKPELSIGARPVSADPRLDNQEKRRATGRKAVFYLAGTENTELGRALYRADVSLGELAFGSTATVRETENRVVGFHSLPELFIEKYARHPAQDLYLGTTTIFLNSQAVDVLPAQSLWSRLWWLSSNKYYELGTPLFAVRFGRNAGPAEAGFATFFTSHFDEIARTELGRPLRDLIPFAQATALFRWLRTNDIRFEARTLVSKAASVPTPADVAPNEVVRLTDILPSAPAILFNSFGPNEIYDTQGRMTVVRYERGLPVEVRRPDGATLRIVRDALGIPVVISDGLHSQSFDIDSELGLVLATNTEVVGQGTSLATKTTERTVMYPISQRESIVASAVARFATGTDDAWTHVDN
jgi:hypothetical protein